jgi:hypothetical protein
MKRSTIVTLLIGLVAGALLTTAVATSSSGRFSLQLCPVPAVTDQGSNVRSSGEEPWTKAR